MVVLLLMMAMLVVLNFSTVLQAMSSVSSLTVEIFEDVPGFLVLVLVA